jgi:hypothetical protein
VPHPVHIATLAQTSSAAAAFFSIRNSSIN